MKSIDLSELHQKFETLTPQQLILDVRTPHEFYAGHIPGARNIPLDQVMNYVGDLKQYTEILVYCKMGGRAATACDILESLGLKNLSCLDDGGFPNWKASGFPAEINADRTQ